jgi:hypothetical protein
MQSGILPDDFGKCILAAWPATFITQTYCKLGSKAGIASCQIMEISYLP